MCIPSTTTSIRSASARTCARWPLSLIHISGDVLGQHLFKGVVYSAETLSRLADILTEKSKAFGHNIFLVSDEPYRDIAFDGKKAPYPAA